MLFKRQLFIYPDAQIFVSRDTINMDTIQGTYSAFGKYSDPLTFSTFCYLILKIDFKSFFLINLYTIHHNDKAKTGFEIKK